MEEIFGKIGFAHRAQSRKISLWELMIGQSTLIGKHTCATVPQLGKVEMV